MAHGMTRAAVAPPMTWSGRTAVLALALVCMSARDAHAYTDPGSGVLLWQMGVAAVLGALFYVRRATKWLKERFGGRGLDEPHS